MTNDQRHDLRCNDCGKFLAFAELCFSKHHFRPLSELGPEQSWWSCPSCRDDWRATQGIEARSGETRRGSIRQDESPVGKADAPKHYRGD